MSITDVPQATGAGVCARCGKSITHPGPDGECVRCLVSFGFLEEEEENPRRSDRDRAKLGPLRYAHFEVEVNPDGHPAILGSGAMAVTYLARDTILNSTVALKVISRKLAEDSTARARFLREARAAAQIHHPNVARVIHYGEQDGECFYAMELVEGETLEARVQREGPLPLSVALEIVEQTARGLAAGERCGVIHRDLKPSNLMIESHAGDELLVKIIDYGVAKVMAARADSTFRTQAGFIGTPSFASPEQFDESGRQQIDTRSDIYALGVTFWYLLTGRPPFAGRSIEEVRAQHEAELPIKQLKNVRVPNECVTLLKSMLAVESVERPQTARELLEKVHRCCLRFDPAQRRRRKQFVAASIALALTIGVVFLVNFVREHVVSSGKLDRAIAVLPFENLSSSAEDHFFAVGIQDEILTKLASVADLKVIARTSTQGYESKPVDLRTVGQQLNVGRLLEGSLQRSGDKVRINVQLIDARTNAHLWASSYDRTLDDVFAVESEVANTIAEQLDASLVRKISTQSPTTNVAAYHAYLRGIGIEHSQAGFTANAEAGRAYAEAVELDPNFALAWARLSSVRSYLYFNGIDQATNSPAAVKQATDRAVALGPELGESWLAQGNYKYRVLRETAAAVEAYREAEKRLPNSALVNQYLAAAERRLGRWREAQAHMRRALELDPRSARLWVSAAQNIYRPLGQWADCEAALNRSLEITPNDSYAISLKAELFQAQGRLEEAGKELARLSDTPSDKGAVIARIQYDLLRRDFDDAILRARQVTDALVTAKPLTPPDILLLILQGYAQKWSERNDDARATFSRVIKELEQADRRNQLPNLGGRSFLALGYAGLGDKQNALEQARLGVTEEENDAILKANAEAIRGSVLSQVDEIDTAIAELPRLLALPAGVSPGDLRYSPFWDPLRKDPRFQRLIENPPAVRY